VIFVATELILASVAAGPGLSPKDSPAHPGAADLSLPKTQSATKSGLFMQSVEGPKDLLNGRPLHI